MQQHRAALHMAEKARAETGAVMGALDETRQIGDDEFLAVDADHAELRGEGGERVIGDLRPGAADRGKEGGFAGIRQPDQRHVGDQLEAQPDPALLAGPTRIGTARRLVGRALVMGVAEAAIAAAGDDDALAGLRQIGQKDGLVLAKNLRADGGLDDQVLASGAAAVLPHAVAPAPRLEMLPVAEVDERIEVRHRLQNDAAAAAAIAAIGPAELDELFPAEG